MPDYRIYKLDPRSGHFIGVEEVTAADDLAALCLTDQRHFEVPTETWCGGRKIACLDARLLPAATAPCFSSRDEAPS